MSLLHYTSNEMFSSTELIRKSKSIFDKIHYEDIDKAVILRDGKPSFIMMDFAKYELLMNEYLKLKKAPLKTNKQKSEMSINSPKDSVIDTTVEQSKSNPEKIETEDFEKALREIDNLEFGKTEKKIEIKKEALEDFWE